MDYSKSQLITIDIGAAQIQTGMFKIIHIIEISKYNEIIYNIENTIEILKDDNNNYPILLSLIQQIKLHMKRLNIHSRIDKRAINILGSAWKWVTGTPDHNDMVILENKINDILQNNNNQVVINKLIESKINEITTITNKIIKIQENSTSKFEIKTNFALKMKYKLELLKEEIVNIAYAIHWAKANIVNSFIIADSEIRLAEEMFNKENIPYVNIDEALEFADVKIAASRDSLIYIISLPTTNTENCKKLEIRPIRKGKYINKIGFKKILVCSNEIYGLKNDCKNFNHLAICEKNKIENITNSSCIPLLLKSKMANCTKINNDNIEEIEEIFDDIILLNDFKGQIKINDENIDLDGSYIIKHVNQTIEINNKRYFSKIVSSNKPLPAMLQLNKNENILEEMLSLEMLKNLNVNSTKHIELLKKKNDIYFTVNVMFLISGIFIVILIFIKFRKNKIILHEQKNTNKQEINLENINEHFKISNEDVRT